MAKINQKILIFDIDGTLCNINTSVNDRLVKLLSRISQDHILVLASGKPVSYIAGFVRQLDLHNCILIGENGGTTFLSKTFPPSDYHQIEVPHAVRELFKTIKNKYINRFGDAVWFQPNDINLTVFPIKDTQIVDIHGLAQECEHTTINTYYHQDSVDFTPKGFNKGTAVDTLLEKLGFENKDLYVFGDGENDISMLAKTKNSVAVRNKSIEANLYVRDFNELTDYLIKEFLS